MTKKKWSNFKKLEELMKDKFVIVKDNCMYCPHKGFPLSDSIKDGNVVECQGHALKWNLSTGKLVESPEC